MNDHPPRPPSDDEVDRLLTRQVRRTSPEFEQRWRALRREIAQGETRPRRVWPRWLTWPGLALTAAAAVAIALRSPPAESGPRSTPVTFEELISLETSLQRATALLEAENREALLYLPTQTRR